MQRRAIRDAKTPEKMKQAKPVVDDSLTLQGKKDKIKSNLQRLGELGKVHPEKKYQDLINDIAKVPILCPLTSVFWDFQTVLECEISISPFHFILKRLDLFVDVGHPEPEAISSEAKGRIGQASADQCWSELQDHFLQCAD